jgi:uncharacterized peroxidase-related enzyme
MTRITPLRPEDLDDAVRQGMETQRRQLGLVPESLLTMAHRPELAAAWAGLTATIVGAGSVDRGLKQLVAYVASSAHGCRYCQAHTAQSAERFGVPLEKIHAAFEAETSPLFSDAERAALVVARAGAMVPNVVTNEQFEELRNHFADDEVVEIVAVLAMFGFLNRWNDTMATTLEAPSLHWSSEHLGSVGWAPEKHAPATT